MGAQVLEKEPRYRRGVTIGRVSPELFLAKPGRKRKIDKTQKPIETPAITAGPEAVITQPIAVIEVAQPTASAPAEAVEAEEISAQIPEPAEVAAEQDAELPPAAAYTEPKVLETKPKPVPKSVWQEPQKRVYPTELDHMRQTQHLLKPSLDIAGIIARNEEARRAREEARRKPRS